MPTRKYRYKEIQDYADQLLPLLAICRQAELSRWPSLVVGEHKPALAQLLPRAGKILSDWLDQLEALKNDLPYRERALRAERELRRLKKRE